MVEGGGIREPTKMRWTSMLFLFAMASALAEKTTYVATTGRDTNNCLSPATACATPTRGAPVAGNRSIVSILPGNYYNVEIQVVHGDDIHFNGDCSNPSAVVLHASQGKAVAIAQNHATLALNCLKLGATGKSSSGIQARQFSIVDWKDVVFGHFPSEKHVVLDEMSKGNCIGNISIDGDAEIHVHALGMSSASLNCAITFQKKPSLDYIITAGENSFVLVNCATFTGAVTVRNNSYAVDTSMLRKGTATIPGPNGTNSIGVVR